jgi:hypothetical protein
MQQNAIYFETADMSNQAAATYQRFIEPEPVGTSPAWLLRDLGRMMESPGRHDSTIRTYRSASAAADEQRETMVDPRSQGATLIGSSRIGRRWCVVEICNRLPTVFAPRHWTGRPSTIGMTAGACSRRTRSHTVGRNDRDRRCDLGHTCGPGAARLIRPRS